MAEKSQRDLYLEDPLHHVEHSNHDAVIPPWLVAEAASEEGWEKAEKERLEISSFAREFRNKFLESFKTENRQMVQTWEPDKAAEWLKKKVLEDGVFDRNKASEILAAAQCLDEKRTEVMRLIGENDEEGKPSSGSPTRNLKDVNPPPTVQEVEHAAQEETDRLHKRKAVGSYGVILTEGSCQLYRKGEKLAEVSTDDCGGYVVLASEIDAMEDEKDVVAFFDLKDDIEEINSIGWGLKPKASAPVPHRAPVRKPAPPVRKAQSRPPRARKVAGPIVDNTTIERIDQDPTSPPQTDFDKSHVDQADPNRVDPGSYASGLDRGPASLNPGAPTDAAPTIPGQDGK